MRSFSLLFAVGLMLAGCDRPEPPTDDSPIDTRNPLEVPARQRGVVQAEASDPPGVLERAHELGRDAMCVVPDGAGRWRFALTAAFGSAMSCLTTEPIPLRGGAWPLPFSGGTGWRDVH